MADLLNKRLGGFRILAEIKGASGSQGQVYKACCEEPPFDGIEVGCIVALKVMPVHDEDGKAWARLQKRTEELVRLSHPNVVKYYGCFSESGPFNDIHVIVQEFLEGETLKQRLEKCPLGLDADEALKVIKGALCGLEYMASNGIVHRDVKPGNIFLCFDGGVKFIDFEIAHKEGGTTTASSNNLIGSFDYMAPDFTDAEFRGDVQSDVFSMGVVMHETITGRTPYKSIDGDNSQANFAFLQRWARLHVDGTSPIQISSRANQLLAHSGTVLAKALAPLSKDRYADFTEFRKGLAEVRFRDLKGPDDVYRILQRVGKGGFGEVFKARSKNTKSLVAIKHLLKAAYAERFYREAKIMAQLRDPCFVNFIGFFVIEHAGSKEAFLVMDFLPGMPGSSLRDAIKRSKGRRLRKREVLLAFARFAHGLAVMHNLGIFHRDIKPSNLYYPAGHPERAAIMDLGIARNIHGTATTGQVPGTLDYMPPEVVLSDNRGDSRMDIYALGLCLFEALSGKMAFPRLPQGAAAYAEFLNRAKSKAKPEISDPVVSSDAALHELVRRMTEPDVSDRLSKAAEIESRLRELAENVPADEPDDEPDDERATGETIIVSDDFEKERERIRERRKVRRLAVAAAAVVAVGVCGVLGVMLRGSIVGWLQSRAASSALPEAEHVVSEYGRGLDEGEKAKADWLARWMPGQGRWVDLDEASFAACTNSIRAAEMKHLDAAAERAADEVIACYEGTDGIAACDEKRAEWHMNWAERCSSGKIDDLEKKIQRGRDNREKRDFQRNWNQFIADGYKIVAGYRGTNTLENCVKQTEEWKNRLKDNGGSPEDRRFKRVSEEIEKARLERVREDDKRVAESELDEVVKSYARSGAEGSGKAESWRNVWEKKLAPDDFKAMEARIVIAQSDCEAAERKRRSEKKQKECEDERLPILAGYRDDSSKKADVDAKYDEWVRKWEEDRDLSADKFTPLVAQVAEEKRKREERIEAAVQELKKAAHEELQSFVAAYGDPMKDRAECDKQAKKWRKKWQGKMDAGVFSEMDAQIESARRKRGDREKWEEEQRILASKTNEIESVRAALVGEYGSDAGQKKAEIDSRFDGWTKKWESDEILQRNLPDWFAGRKRTVATAKSACEARIAESKRIARVAAKTNEVVTARKQLENGYKTDTSDKTELDEKFTEWVRKWSSDTELPLGWFAEQRQPVERERAAREVRDESKRQEQKAGKEADSVCETYRTDGVAVGDGSRKMWTNAWTNALESTVFQSLSQKIDKARGKRVEEEMKQQAREESESVCEAYRGSGVKAGDDKRQEWSNKWNNKLAVASFRELSQTIDNVRAEVAKGLEGILVSKTNDVVSVCAELVRDYGNDALKKSEIDSRFAKWADECENDEVLRNSLPNWFTGQRKIVETAKGARENRIKQRMAQIEKDRKDLEDGYRDDSSDKAKLDAKFDKWPKNWDKEVNNLTSDWLAEQMDAVKKEKAAREKRDADRERARVQANDVCDFYRKSGRTAGDVSRTMWINTWTNVLGEAVFNDLSRQIDEARAVAAVPEPPKTKPDKEDDARKRELVASRQNEVLTMRRQLEEGYKTDTTDKADLDRKFAEWTAKWEKDAELPAGWFEAQKIVVETIQKAREDRDRIAQQALKQAAEQRARIAAKTNEVEAVRSELVRDYANDSIKKSKVDARFDEWTRRWEYDADLQQLLPKWFAGLKATVEDARREREDRLKKLVASKMSEVGTMQKQLETGYKSDTSNKAELDTAFEEWVSKWKDDADLPPGWFAEQRLAVVTEKMARERRDAQATDAETVRLERERAEKNRKEAHDDAVKVCKGYESGVEAGETERQLWEGKWKSILAEATYKQIYDVIDAARLKAVEERKRKERLQLERQIRASLEVDKDHVERWKGQLADAERKVADGKSRGVLDAQNAATLQGEIDKRKKWVVGVVANQTSQEIEFSDQRIAPGRRGYFEFKDGMPAGGLPVSCTGYKPLAIDKVALDGAVVQIGSGKWKLVPVPKAPVPVPAPEAPEPANLDDFFKQKLKDVELSLEVDDGEQCLRVYHEICGKGYRLTATDKANIEQSFGICSDDYKAKLHRAIVDPRFKEEDVRKWWDGVKSLYNSLTR